MKEYEEILKEMGLSSRRSNKMAPDLMNSLKKRGFKQVQEKVKKKKKDIMEIDNTYLKEDEIVEEGGK